jgi:excisionase family DNA binding protein
MKFQLTKPQKPKKPAVERLGVSIEDAAEMLSVSERTVRELTSSGKLACKRIGRRVIYSVEVLKAFLHSDIPNIAGKDTTEDVATTNAHQAAHNQQTEEENEWHR